MIYDWLRALIVWGVIFVNIYRCCEGYPLLIRQMVLPDIRLLGQGDKLGTSSACLLLTEDGISDPSLL